MDKTWYRNPVVLNIVQGCAEVAQQFITGTPIYYIMADMTQRHGGILLARYKSGGGYITVEWVTRLSILQLIERRSEARWIYLGSGSVYDTSDQIQDRTGLTGTPLGVGLAIILFIHEIAFVNIWPNQQARWVLWMYSQDSSDIRYNKCKHNAREQLVMQTQIINLHGMLNKKEVKR